jgi:tRNA nucleotidyltransferase (CCA-adding enzyme)
MHSPVFAVCPETEMREIDRALEQQAYSGACVLSGGRLVGVISGSDIERAKSSDQLSLKVKSFMSSQVITTAPDVPLDQLLESMADHDVGRLPVLDGQRLIGIVTRTDVRRALYGES